MSSINDIRNFGIIAHIDAGKTSITERMLYYAGIIHKAGEVHDGNTTMDDKEEEQKRGITITGASTAFEWNDLNFKLQDLPGHISFTAEVERALRVVDGAVVLFCGKSGVQPQSETVWRQADKYGVPRIAFVNKMDIVGADFNSVLKDIERDLGAHPLPLQLPIGLGAEFEGVIDLITMEEIRWTDKDGLNIVKTHVSDENIDRALFARNGILEAAAMANEDAFEEWEETSSLEIATIYSSIRMATITGEIIPVLCGSAYKNKGVQPLLDAVINYLPSPMDVPPAIAMNEGGEEVVCLPDKDSPLAALVFKVVTDKFFGKLLYARIYSGTLRKGSSVYNASKGKKERIGRLFRPHASKMTDIEEAHPGDVIALVGTKLAVTGNTFCDLGNNILLESIDFPEPVIQVSIEAEDRASIDKLGLALAKLSEEDPTFKTWTDNDTGQTIIAGMGELHLEILVSRLRKEFRLSVQTGQPRVSYRETITREASAEGKDISQTGGRGRYGHCFVKIAPNKPGEGFTFSNDTYGGSVPKKFIKPVQNGIVAAMTVGILKEYPVVDVHVSLYDGSTHNVDASEQAYHVAGSRAFKAAMAKARPILLEPYMRIEVLTPEDFLGAVLGSLSSRRARIEAIDDRRNVKQVKGVVPLSEMFKYVGDLRSKTKGRGSYAMEFSHYEPVPAGFIDSVG